MNHLSRTHGISVRWLHERFADNAFELVFEPSCTQCADLFTKTFSNPFSWSAACQLIGLARPDDVVEMVSRGGRPPPAPEGGGKLGRWEFKSDGSGTWTRIDASATRFRSLYEAGPLKSEVTLRVTFDGKTGEMIGSPMRDYATSKAISESLPEPVPRPVRTVFHFDRTTREVPPERRNEM